MSGSRFAWPNTFSVDAAGVPRVGAQLFFYETGTNTPQNTYSDSALTVPNTNPVISDALGQFGNIFLLPSPSYRVVLQDADSVTIWVMDPVGSGAGSSGNVAEVQAGALVPYAGASVPSNYLLCYGQAVSRTVYASLFTAINTLWGPGDGSTTFNVPDFRGRVPAGKDDMGGSGANRLTNAISGVDGLTLGASGGDQRVQTHNHSVTDPGHMHGVTDGGHHHDYPTSPGGITGFAFWQNGGIKGAIGAGGLLSLPQPSTRDATTGISINNGTTSITIDNYGAGGAQNVQPTAVVNWMIFVGA